MLSAWVTFEAADGVHYAPEHGLLTVPSGRAGTWMVRLQCLDQPLPAGAMIGIQRYNIHFAHRFQTDWPQRRDFVSVECSGSARVTFSSRLDRDWRLQVEEGAIEPGDIITIRLGDRRNGSVGSETFWSTTTGRLTVSLVDGDATSKLADDMLIRVTHRETPSRLRFLGPSRVAVGETFGLNLVVFDLDCNVVEDWQGTVRLDPAADGVTGLPAEVSFTTADRGMKRIDGVSLERAGVVRITARMRAPDLQCCSNPIEAVAGPVTRIAWGELHAHGWGDQSMLLMHDRTDKLDPAGRHRQAREVGRYDYAAPSAMAMPDDDDQRRCVWQAYLDAWRDQDEPGRYVPFMAMEMHPRRGGDWTLIFRDEGELPPSYGIPVEDVFAQYGSREDAFLEGHLGGSVPKFADYLPEPGHVRLIEVASAFGGAEWILQEALALGFEPAITGASDLHLGLMGAPRSVETFRGRFGKRLNVRDAAFGSGPVGAIVTTDITRHALWEALQRRYTYATTGDRMIVDLDAGGQRMGDKATLPSTFEVRLTVEGEDAVERADLIVGDRLAMQKTGDGTRLEWAFTFDRRQMPRGGWFYFRIKQVNNEFAWTAPIVFADGAALGLPLEQWPAWNALGPPACEPSEELTRHVAALEAYLATEGDRERFGDLRPCRLVKESYGRCAVVLSTWQDTGWPVTLRWFVDYEIPKLRVDYGYEMVGVVNCEAGPSEPPPAIPGT